MGEQKGKGEEGRARRRSITGVREAVCIKPGVKEVVVPSDDYRQLLEVQARFNGFINSSKDAIGWALLDGTLVEVNPAFCILTGYSRVELLDGKTYQDLTPERFQSWEAEKIRRILETGQPDEYEKEYIRKDGSLVPILLTAFVVQAEGEILGVAAIIKDITEIKQTQDALRRHREQLSSLVDERAEDLKQTNEKLQFQIGERRNAERRLARQAAVLQAINEVFVAALTCETEEALGKVCLSVAERLTESKFGFLGELNELGRMDTIAISNPGWDACKMSLHDAQRSTRGMPLRGIDRATLRDEEPRIVNQDEMANHPDRVGTPDGHPEVTAFLGAPLELDGKTIGMIGLANKPGGYVPADQEAVENLGVAIVQVLKRQRAEHALNLSQEQLRQAQKMEAVGRLAGGIAHDFNNLLTAILGYGELLLSQPEARGPMGEDLQAMMDAGRKAADLTGQLLAFSRKQVLEPTVLELNALVRKTESLLRRVIGEDINLISRLDPEVPAIRADPGQLSQVLMNLSVNARDAMPTGGTLTVRTSSVDSDEYTPTPGDGVPPGRYALLTVSDTGSGMDDETLSRIFEPFFTTKGPGKGTGLGLSKVYGIVKQSGGIIQVASQPTGGTTFKVYLPVAEGEEAAVHADSQEAESPRGGETVLVVEDDKSVRKLAVRVLRRQGYEVLVAAGPEEALRIHEDHEGPINLLLTDVVMPQMSGKVLFERLTATDPHLAVLFMSGFTEEIVSKHGVLEEGISLLRKPFLPTDLCSQVRETLEKQ